MIKSISRNVSHLLFGCIIIMVLCMLLFRHHFLWGTVLMGTRWVWAGFLFFLSLMVKDMPRKGIAFFCLLLLFAEWYWDVSQHYRLPDTTANTAPMNVKIMTYNLFFKNRRPDLSLRLIKKQMPDILALQELTPQWEELLSRELSTLYPYRYTRPLNNAYGIGIYSKYPIKNNEYVYNSKGRLLGQYIFLDIDGKGLFLGNVHLSSPAVALENPKCFYPLYKNNFKQRYSEYAQVNLWFRSRTTFPKIVVGDFNTMDIDPLYKTILEEWGDLYTAKGEGFGRNFPNSSTIGHPLTTLDYIFMQGKLRPISAKVIRKGKSDHFAIMGTIGL